jgi:O-antigen ligase
MVILSGVLFNFSYILGVLFHDIAGLSLLPWLSLVALIISIKHPSFKIFHILILLLVLSLYYIGVVFSDWGSYSTYKAQMFALKALPLMFIPLILKDKIYDFLAGYAIPIVIFLPIAFMASVSMAGTVNINDRLEIGIFNPIWISRAALELTLLGFIVFAIKKPYMLLILLLTIPVVYTAGSKGPILSFVLVILLWFLKERCITRSQRIKMVFFVGILAIGAVSSTSFMSNDSYFYQRFLLQVPDGSESIDQSRGVVWPLVIDKIFSQDFTRTLFGHGIGEFESFFYGTSSGERYYPHNLFLELIVENGIVATAFIVGIYVYIYKSSASPLKYLFAFAFFNAQFSGDILLNEGLLFYGGALLANKKLFNKNLDARRFAREGQNQ